MRKAYGFFILVILFVLSLPAAWAVGAADAADTTYKGRTHTVAWDASLLEDETPCTDCRYEIWIKNIATNAEAKIGETAELQLVVTLPAQGRYRVGGLAKRIVDGVEETSEKVWSDNPDVCAGGQTFLFRWVPAPLGIHGIRRAP